ncbi:MAG: hypothetical protein JNN22_14635 [Rhodospirillales bacterium]|nr:hypothetical protein [Rhodospirillales bacterium]
MEFIDAFDPDNAACERKFAFRSWTRIASSFNDLGYRVHVTRNMADVRAFWSRLPDAKREAIRMPPVQDIAYHPHVGPEDFVAFLATRAGENTPSAMVGARRIWIERSLKEEMEDLTFWYGERAEEMRRLGRRCEVSAPSAREIDSDHIAWMGAGMNVSGDPLIYRAIVRASLFFVATHWRFKATVSIVERSTFRVHGFDWYGFRRNEMAIYRDDNEFLLATMPRRELLAEARHAAFADVAKPLLARRRPGVAPGPVVEPVPMAG